MIEISPEQKLVDLCFSLFIAASEDPTLRYNNRQYMMDWVSWCLKENGFPTIPCGLSWGVLNHPSAPEYWKNNVFDSIKGIKKKRSKK